MIVIGTPMTLGEFVVRRRGILGLTQRELIERLPAWDRSRISRIENDQLSHPLDTEATAELAAALECSQLDILEAQGFVVREPEETGQPSPYALLEDLEVMDLPAELRASIRESIRLAIRLKREQDERNGEIANNGAGQ